MNSERMRIVAHRGGLKRGHENTLSAFRRAIDDGADGFECDVVLTKDGEPVVLHKPFYTDSVTNLTDHKGRLKELDWKTLKELRTNGERIPHLNDTLEFVSSCQTECFIEPKIVSSVVVEKILTAIGRYGVERKVQLITFFHRRTLLCNSKKLNPTVKTSVMLVSPFGNWRSKADLACADMIVPGWKGLGLWKSFNHLKLLGALFVDIRKKIEAAQQVNLPVYSGIADDEDNIKWLCDLGVDGIFTDDVPLARRIVSRSC